MNSKEREVMALALEALTIQSDRVTEIGKKREAITAIKEALNRGAMDSSPNGEAQPEQVGINGLTEAETNATASVFGLVNAATQQRDSSATPRTWVELTDDEIYMNCPNWLSQEQCKVWIEQIEAKLKAKNERLEKNTRNGGCL